MENPAHRRSHLVRLTPQGRAPIDAVSAQEHELLACVGGGLTGAELTATLRVLHHMDLALIEIEQGTAG